mmetsp:Transcript_17189/g.39963  ORF Transcript_17189/g.39963 Transcript_17189/m.39963 type:complete len:599 (+) Transcript_17189:436-2232(+)
MAYNEPRRYFTLSSSNHPSSSSTVALPPTPPMAEGNGQQPQPQQQHVSPTLGGGGGVPDHPPPSASDAAAAQQAHAQGHHGQQQARQQLQEQGGNPNLRLLQLQHGAGNGVGAMGGTQQQAGGTNANLAASGMNLFGGQALNLGAGGGGGLQAQQQQQLGVAGLLAGAGGGAGGLNQSSLNQLVAGFNQHNQLAAAAAGQQAAAQQAAQQQAQQQQGLALQTQHHGAAQPPAVLSNATLQSGGASGNLRSYASAIASGGTASSSAGLGQKQQSVTFQNDGGLSSWPHFSSVSSLNNMGGLSGVKSITNLSSADLASQGNLNRMGNLAQVKSSENMGKADSFAFLEVFFNNKEGSGNQQVQRGVKRERDEDDGAIGLSLDGDDAAGPSSGIAVKQEDEDPNSSSSAVKPAPLTGDENAEEEDGGGLKRAYDDALAARGLIAVRQSSEKLTDLALPAKMQRTLSQEYIRQHNQGAPMGDFFNAQASSAFSPNRTNRVNGVGTFGQATAQQQAAMGASDQSVQVPSTTKCSLCYQTNVDTQLRPCGHMFHGSCLKPSLQQNGAACPPKCPICGTPMQSAILAIPTATQQPNLHLVGGMELQ